MKLSILTNDVLTKGAILGGVMLASLVAEQSMVIYGCSVKWMLIFMLEWLTMIGVFCYLLYRFTSNYATLVLSERKEMPYFSYGEGWMYVIKISVLAGVIVSIGGYVFQYCIVGYDTYMEAVSNLLRNIVADLPQGQSEEVYANLEQSLSEVKSLPQPTMIDALFSGVTSYLFGGAMVGLVVAAITKRAPQMFNK
jgi:hypothetical protein